jgi:hypothetical protein
MTKAMAAMVTKYHAISDARGEWQAAWVRACAADGIPANEGSKFVVFSEGNPHKAELDLAGAKYLAAIHAMKPQNSEGVCA